MASDLRPSIDLALEAFGLPATVIRPAPDNAPVETTAIWTVEEGTDLPAGNEMRRRDPRRILTVRRLDFAVPPPRASLIDAPEYLGGPMKRWRVERIDRSEFDAWRLVVEQA